MALNLDMSGNDLIVNSVRVGAASVSTAAGPSVYSGTGAPTLSAVKGSLFIRTDGSSTSTRLYVNTNGATTWTNFTSAA